MRPLLLLPVVFLAACSSSTYVPSSTPPQAATDPGTVTTENGVVYRDLVPGTGPSPKPTDNVTVNYVGHLVTGEEFDSSYKRNKPAQFNLNRVIKCWTEGVPRMKVGGKARLICPAEVAYGAQGAPPRIPPKATLIFEIELLAINPA